MVWLAICQFDAGLACLKCFGLLIERLRVRIPAGAAGEFSSPKIALCADSHSVAVFLQWHIIDPGHPAEKCR